MADIAPPRPKPQPRRSTVTQNPPVSLPALRSPGMPNSSPNFSNAPTPAMQATNFGTNLSTARRSIDPSLGTLINGRKMTELERRREEYIEKLGEEWRRLWVKLPETEEDVKEWFQLMGLSHGYQVFYETKQSVGGPKFKDTRGYVEHSEECGGVTLNPTGAGWHSSNMSFGEY